MNDEARFVNSIEELFIRGPRPVVELVWDLLSAADAHGVRLGWDDGKCDISSVRTTGEHRSVALPLSVFRAVLARLAALCERDSHDDFSPYRWEGKLVWDADSTRHFWIDVTNNHAQGFLVTIQPISPSDPARSVGKSLSTSINEPDAT
jgi:hypothetical protein